MGISENQLSVDLVLREISSDVYSWNENIDETVFSRNNTNFFVIKTLNTPGLTLSEELRIFNEKVITVIKANASSSDNFHSRFEVQIKKNIDTQWIPIGTSSNNLFEYIDAEDGVIYNVRVRSIGSFQQTSAWRIVNITPEGKTAPPSNVTNFSANVVGDQTVLSWSAVPDLDLSHYVIRFRDGYGVSRPNNYSNARTIYKKIPRPATSVTTPTLNGTYYIKAVDKLGFESLNSTSITTSVKYFGYQGLLTGYGRAQTIQEDSAFAGTLDDVAVVDSQLVLDTSINFDSASGDFDDLIGRFDGGGGYVDNEGTYTFSNVLDLGDIYTVKLTSYIDLERKDYVDVFDDASGNFDARSGLFDGDQAENGKTNADLYVSYTDDDPTGTPTWSDYRLFVSGSYNARAYRFKVIMQSEDSSASPAINELRVYADMIYTNRQGDDVSSGAGAKAITFSPAFYPAYGSSDSRNSNLKISAQDLQSGDYYTITGKTESGFTITFRNSGGTAVNRTFDYLATGLSELNN